ncbi:reverse transcriptase domain-containing protein [Tanacetum coccineum]
MANTTPIVTTVTKPTTKEKTSKEADATPRVNIQDFCVRGINVDICRSFMGTRFTVVKRKVRSMLALDLRIEVALTGGILLTEIILGAETALVASKSHMIIPAPPMGHGPNIDIARATETTPVMRKKGRESESPSSRISESGTSDGGHKKSRGPRGSRKKFPSGGTGGTLGNAYLVSYVQFYLNRSRKTKKYVKDPVKIHNIKQRDGETIEEFMKRFKVETRRMKGAPECIQISGFMHGVNNLESTKSLNEHVPKTMEEMMITTTAFIRGEAAAAGKKKGYTSSLSTYYGIIGRPGYEKFTSGANHYTKECLSYDGGIVDYPVSALSFIRLTVRSRSSIWEGRIRYRTEGTIVHSSHNVEMLGKFSLGNNTVNGRQEIERERAIQAEESYSSGTWLRDIDVTLVRYDKINMMLNPKKEVVLQLSSPRTIKEVQSLNGKLDSLNRFLSKPVERSLPLFKILKKCIKKSDFHWTPKAEQAFKQLKQYLLELPLLVAPKPKEELIVYLSATHGAISAVLMTERGTVQTLVYFISRTLHGPELNYTPMEKLVLSLVFAAKRLRRYFQAHPIAVVTNQPIKNIISHPDVAGRLQKWSVMLGEHNITYWPRTSVKGQILVDFLIEKPDESPSDSSVVETPQEPWTLFTGGSSCVDGSRAGLILTSPEGTFAHLSKQVLVEILKEKSIQEKKATTVVEEDGPTWMTPTIEYLKEGTLPDDKKEATKLRIKARQYELLEGILYRRSFLKPWLWCIRPLRANYVIREIHEGSCSMHFTYLSLHNFS